MCFTSNIAYPSLVIWTFLDCQCHCQCLQIFTFRFLCANGMYIILILFHKLIFTRNYESLNLNLIELIRTMNPEMIATLKLSITWSSCCESRIWWEYLLNYISNYIGIHNTVSVFTKCRHTTVWLNLWGYHTNWDHARSLWCNIAAIWLFYVTKLSSLNYQWTSFMVFILIDSFNTSYFLYIYIYFLNIWTMKAGWYTPVMNIQICKLLHSYEDYIICDASVEFVYWLIWKCFRLLWVSRIICPILKSLLLLWL